MKRLVPILVITILVALVCTFTPVLAQEGCSETEQTFAIPESFPLTNEDFWQIVPQTYGHLDPDDIGDDGFTITSDSWDGFNSGVNLVLHLSAPVTITFTSLDVTDGSGMTTGASVTVCHDEECTDTENIILHNAADPWHEESDTDYTDVLVIVLGLATSGTGAQSATMDNLVIQGLFDSCLFRPLHDADQVDEEVSGPLYLISTNAGARVFAISDGIIQSVFHNANGYAVQLLVNGATLVTYSELSATFAEPGDSVEGGCVLGYVRQAGPEAEVNTGQFLYQHDSDLGDWHDYAESLSTTPCGQEDSNCINANPEMNGDQSGWLTRFNSGGSFNQGDDSVKSIVGAGMLYQPDIVADFEATYFVTLVVALNPPATNGEVRVWFGGTETRLPIHTVGSEFVTITTLGFSTGFAGPTEFRLYNGSSNSPTVRVTFACLHLGDAVIAPPPCYFDDALINADSFETEGGATFETGFLGQGGQYRIPPTGAIRSPINIEATTDADSDFTLTIAGTGPDGPAEVTASIVDSDTDDELQAIGEYIFPLLLWGNVKREFTLEASSSLDGDLYIENTGDEDVVIGSVCLSSNSGSWPGYENTDATSHDILALDCTECNFPESLIDVVAWVNWLGCLFNYLVRCLLYGLINNIWATASAILSGVALFGLWLGRAISIIADWAWRAAGRLLATLLSSAIPLINAILAWLLTLPFVQSLLDTTAIIRIWVEGIFTLITNVLLLFGRTIQFIYVLFNTFGIAWAAFFNALSASPEVTVVLPDCNDSGSPFYDACLVFDILNFLLAAVPAMGLLGAALVVKIGWNRMRKAFKGLEEIFSI